MKINRKNYSQYRKTSNSRFATAKFTTYGFLCSFVVSRNTSSESFHQHLHEKIKIGISDKNRRFFRSKRSIHLCSARHCYKVYAKHECSSDSLRDFSFSVHTQIIRKVTNLLNKLRRQTTTSCKLEATKTRRTCESLCIV